MSFPSMSLVTALSAFTLSTCLTFGIVYLSSRLPWLARSSSNRLHLAPTPVWGGIAIFLSFMGVAAGRGLFHGGDLMIAAVSTAGIFLLGLADDIWKLQPRWKLLGQIACGLGPISFVLRH